MSHRVVKRRKRAATPTVPFGPFGEWIKQRGHGAITAAADEMREEGPQVIINWRNRGGIPQTKLGAVCHVMGITEHRYRVLAGDPDVDRNLADLLDEYAAMSQASRAALLGIAKHIRSTQGSEPPQDPPPRPPSAVSSKSPTVHFAGDSVARGRLRKRP